MWWGFSEGSSVVASPVMSRFLLLSRLVRFLGSLLNGASEMCLNPILSPEGIEATAPASHCLTHLKYLLFFFKNLS